SGVKIADAAYDHFSFSQSQTIYQIVIPVDITTLQIFQKTAALTDEFQKPTTRMVVLPVRSEMIGQFIDALCEERNLNFRRTGIRRVCLILRNEIEFSFFCQSHY